MRSDRLDANVLSMRVVPNVDPVLTKGPPLKPEHRSSGVVTSDCGDITHVALGEVTKATNATVVYGKNTYAGVANTPTRSTDEVIGITAGPSPAEVNSGLSVITQVVEQEASLYSANEDDSTVYFVHVISRTGSFLPEQANIPEGEVIAYLIVPSLEAVIGLGAAMKAADAQTDVSYSPPSETNSGGASLTGSQSARKAACSAFEQVIQDIADNPLSC